MGRGEMGEEGNAKGRGRRSGAAMSKGNKHTYVFQMLPAMILRDNCLLIHSDHANECARSY